MTNCQSKLLPSLSSPFSQLSCSKYFGRASRARSFIPLTTIPLTFPRCLFCAAPLVLALNSSILQKFFTNFPWTNHSPYGTLRRKPRSSRLLRVLRANPAPFTTEHLEQATRRSILWHVS